MVITPTIGVKGDNNKGGQPGNPAAKSKKSKQVSGPNSGLNTNGKVNGTVFFSGSSLWIYVGHIALWINTLLGKYTQYASALTFLHHERNSVPFPAQTQDTRSPFLFPVGSSCPLPLCSPQRRSPLADDQHPTAEPRQ